MTSDANRNLGTITDARGGVWAYGYDNKDGKTYDNANQLSSIGYARAGSAIGDLSYQFDAAGRRVGMGGSLARMGLPGAIASTGYNAANQLSTWAGATHTYDLNGNLTNDGSKTYTWDSRNRLKTIAGAATASFSYDAMGRRSGKTIAAATTNFLYDGVNPVQEPPARR